MSGAALVSLSVQQCGQLWYNYACASPVLCQGYMSDEQTRVFTFSGCKSRVARPESTPPKSKPVLHTRGLWIRSQVFKRGEYIKVQRHVSLCKWSQASVWPTWPGGGFPWLSPNGGRSLVSFQSQRDGRRGQSRTCLQGLLPCSAHLDVLFRCLKADRTSPPLSQLTDRRGSGNRMLGKGCDGRRN